MRLKDYPDSQLLSTLDVLSQVKNALKEKKPFSIVRIGDAENIIMAQRVIFSDAELAGLKWLNDPQYNTGERGVSLPNIEQRDRTVNAVHNASIVGICKKYHDELIADKSIKRELTDKLFDYYKFCPKKLCYVFVNRKIVSQRLFWELLHNYKVLLISRWAPLYWDLLKRTYQSLRPQIVGWIDITNYNQIDHVLDRAGEYDFDLALISAGTSAIILAPELAKRYGKVAIDFGHVMAFTLTKDPRVAPWKPPLAPSKNPSPAKKKPQSKKKVMFQQKPRRNMLWMKYRTENQPININKNRRNPS